MVGTPDAADTPPPPSNRSALHGSTPVLALVVLPEVPALNVETPAARRASPTELERIRDAAADLATLTGGRAAVAAIDARGRWHCERPYVAVVLAGLFGPDYRPVSRYLFGPERAAVAVDVATLFGGVATTATGEPLDDAAGTVAAADYPALPDGAIP